MPIRNRLGLMKNATHNRQVIRPMLQGATLPPLNEGNGKCLQVFLLEMNASAYIVFHFQKMQSF